VRQLIRGAGIRRGVMIHLVHDGSKEVGYIYGGAEYYKDRRRGGSVLHAKPAYLAGSAV
jgi:hypothetical protein